MMSLTTYALVLVPCLVGAAALAGVTASRRSAARLDRRAAKVEAAAATPPRRPRAHPGPVRRVAGR
ncbi:hypothetical protein [Methylobacterium platani]|uniref:Uncharacterized protein n=2 Tax=Methylobacterium platani TaxID=427683 RepID=A0A179S6Y9_9HYPH|nr:hypothetical protein [Methylobacterium platani]KMO13430.1 hypothetical protein SQ03_21900 [Methylobacterium platani JCM 14648]OAS20319.1 hypothetical protein A5481_22295 [Methylobacterium platani]